MKYVRFPENFYTERKRSTELYNTLSMLTANIPYEIW